MTATTLQRAIGARPVGVAIVACNSPSGPQGLLVGTLASLSSDPPRVSFAIASTAGPLAGLRAAAILSIQLLAPNQADFAAQFSDSNQTAARFASPDWQISPDQPPRLAGVAACIIGTPGTSLILKPMPLFVVGVSSACRFGDSTLLYQDGRFIN